jgi:hypothetical protein
VDGNGLYKDSIYLFFQFNIIYKMTKNYIGIIDFSEFLIVIYYCYYLFKII